jgi:CDP-diacylglycerol--serine O-phosphatidyltransferase
MARPELRRTVVLLPNGFTLANLFFGIFAIISAARGQYDDAGYFVIFGGVADALDGRIARATRTGSRFGSELDSLVDAISFGLAPAMIMYFAALNREGWAWLLVFWFTACAVIRLARFNVEQAGRAKSHFHGLPSPAAGMTLATYYLFSQTPLYNQTMIANLPWHVMLGFIMFGLGFLMISNVSYAAVPTIGYKSVKGILGSLVVLGTIVGVIFLPKQFFFPALLAYVVYGVGRTVFLGLLDRLPGGIDDDEEDLPPETGSEMGPALESNDQVPASDGSGRRRRRRRPRRRSTPPSLPRAEDSGG